jgi:hypothetical protein
MIPLQTSDNMMPLQTSESMIPLQTSESMIPLQTSESMIPLQTSDNMIPRFSVEVVIVFLLEVERLILLVASIRFLFQADCFSIKRFGLPFYNRCATHPSNLTVPANQLN